MTLERGEQGEGELNGSSKTSRCSWERYPGPQLGNEDEKAQIPIKLSVRRDEKTDQYNQSSDRAMGTVVARHVLSREVQEC